MGYDLTRFISNVDEELQCQICTFVLENPAETRCEHLFCNDCIVAWLSNDKSCPVDRLPLTLADLRPPIRLLRNLIGKLDTQCDFHENGCREIVRLDNLQNHCSKCIYHPTATVTCDKGCNQKISRRDYEEKSCMAHLEMKVQHQQEEITQLNAEICLRVRENIDAVDVVTGLRLEIARLNDEAAQQRDEIRKLNEAINVLPSQVAQLNRLRFFNDHPPNWQTCVNIKIEIVYPCILMENDNKSVSGVMQSSYCLSLSNPLFKIHILKSGGLNLIAMGLAHRGNSIESLGQKNFYSYRSNGTVVRDKECVSTGEMWKEGDEIKCTMAFGYGPNSTNCIEFFRNGRKIKRLYVNLPTDGLFPTIII